MRKRINLTYQEISEIKAIYEQGSQLSEIAKKYQRNASTIFRVLKKVYSSEDLKNIKEKRNKKDLIKNSEVYKLLLCIKEKLNYLESIIKQE